MKIEKKDGVVHIMPDGDGRPQYQDLVEKISKRMMLDGADGMQQGIGSTHRINISHDDDCSVFNTIPGACDCDPVVGTGKYATLLSDDRKSIASPSDESVSEREKLLKKKAEIQDQISDIDKKIETIDNPDWFDSKTCMVMGATLWGLTYKTGMNDEEVHKFFTEYEDSGLGNEGRRTIRVLERTFAARWAKFAFPKIVTSHTYAAALMCTDVGTSAVEDLIVQWPAFEVDVPDKIIAAGGYECDRIRVTWGSPSPGETTAFGLPIMMLLSAKTRRVLLMFAGKDVAALFLPNPESAFQPDYISRVLPAELSVKFIMLSQRLVVGLLLAMQHTVNFKERRCGGQQTKGNKRGEPKHRVVFVGAPTRIDARPAVAAYLSGERRGKSAPASFQVLVRGHYKRQVVGIARGGRKVVWIQPYWRGPEDAPILTRPQRVVH